MMDSKHIKIANSEIIPEIIKMLHTHPEVTIRAAGRSMHPYIHDGKDMLVFSLADQSRLAVGDMVLGLTDKGQYVMHRIIRIEGDTITLKGDGNLYGTETCLRHHIYARLVAIDRNGHRIDCNTPAQRLKATLLRWYFQIPRKIYHGVLKKSKI